MGSIDLYDTCRFCKIKGCQGHDGVIPGLQTYLAHVLKGYLPTILKFIGKDGEIMMESRYKESLFKKNIKTLSELIALLKEIKTKTIPASLDTNEEKVTYHASDLPTIEYKLKVSERVIATPMDLDRYKETILKSEWMRFGNVMLIFVNACFLNNIMMTPNSHRSSIYDPVGHKFATNPLTLIGPAIIKTSKTVKEEEYADTKVYRQHAHNYFSAITNYLSGSKKPPQPVTGQHVISNSPTASPIMKVGTKQGLMRGTMIKKTQNKTARAVSLCDSGLKPNEIGIPVSIMKIMTVEVEVTEGNVDILNRMLVEDRDWPRIIMIINETGTHRREDEGFLDIVLVVKDWVVRTMCPGDSSKSNRPPSLYATSTGYVAAKGTIINGGMSFNPIYYSEGAYGDFDGDVNSTKPIDDERVAAELIYLMHPDHYGKKSTDGVYAYASSASSRYIMMRLYLDDPKLSRNIAIRTFPEMLHHELFRDKSKKYINAIDIFELLLPTNMTMVYDPEFHPVYDVNESVSIVDGKILSKHVDTTLLKGSAGSNIFDWNYTNHGKQHAAELSHKINSCLDKLGSRLGYNIRPSDMCISPKNWKDMGDYYMLKCKIAENVMMMYASKPEKFTKNGTSYSDVYLLKHLDPLEQKSDIIQALPRVNSNTAILSGLASRGHDKDAVSLGNIPTHIQIGGKYPNRTIDGRSSPMHAINAQDPKSRGVSFHPNVVGTDVGTYMGYTQMSLELLKKRVTGTSQPGQYSRVCRIDQGKIHVNKLGMICEGTPDTYMKVLSMRHGFWNININNGVMMEMKVVYPVLQRAVEYAPMELRDDALRWFEIIDTEVRNTKELKIAEESLKQIELPFNFEHLLRDEIDNHVTIDETIHMVRNFIKHVDACLLGPDYVEKSEDIPTYMTDGFAAYKLLIIEYLFTGGYKHYTGDGLDKFLLMCLRKVSQALPPENLCVGGIAAINQGQIMTQKTLSAPKSKSGTNPEIEAFINYMCTSAKPFKRDFKVITTESGLNYQKYVSRTLIDVLSGYEVYATPNKFKGKLHTSVLKPLGGDEWYLTYTLSIRSILKHGLKSTEVLLILASQLDVLDIVEYTDLHITVLTTISIEDMMFNACNVVVEKLAHTLYITSTKGISMIKEEKKDGYVEVFITAQSIEHCMQVPIVTNENLIPMHGVDVIDHVGFIVGFAITYNTVTKIFPEISQTTSLVTTNAVLMPGEFTPINTSYPSKGMTGNILADMALSSPDKKIKKMVELSGPLEINDITSTMMMHSDTVSGTKSFISYK